MRGALTRKAMDPDLVAIAFQYLAFLDSARLASACSLRTDVISMSIEPCGSCQLLRFARIVPRLRPGSVSSALGWSVENR